MPTGNGDRVTVRELYHEIRDLEERQSKEREQMEARLVAVIRSGNDDILKQVGCNRQDIDRLQGDVVDLRVADKRWTGIAAVIAAVIAGIGAALGANGK